MADRLRPHVSGWDGRDYDLWQRLECLPSYGLLGGGDRMVSLRAVVDAIQAAANARRDRARQLREAQHEQSIAK